LVIIVAFGKKKPPSVVGRAGPLCPSSSGVNFLGDLKGIVERTVACSRIGPDFGPWEQVLANFAIGTAEVVVECLSRSLSIRR